MIGTVGKIRIFKTVKTFGIIRILWKNAAECCFFVCSYCKISQAIDKITVFVMLKHCVNVR